MDVRLVARNMRVIKIFVGFETFNTITSVLELLFRILDYQVTEEGISIFIDLAKWKHVNGIYKIKQCVRYGS